MLTQLEDKHTLFDSLEEMISPEVMSRLLERHVAQVTCQPFDSPGGFSGNQLLHVNADGSPLVLKRMRTAHDWISIATEDQRCRALRIWQYGLLDRLQPHMQHGILAACRDGDDHAILMQDVSAGIARWTLSDDILSWQLIRRLLDAQTAMHAMFWQDESLTAAELGLCDAEKIISYCWPVMWPRFQHDPQIVEKLKQGWETLLELVDTDVRDSLQSLWENPQPLWDALARFPATFVHADYRFDNLAMLPGSDKPVVFDWQIAGFAPATICLSWFLMTGDLFSLREAAAEYYRQQLAGRLGNRFDPGAWQAMLEVGGLVDVLRKGNWHALFAVTSEDEAFRTTMRSMIESYNGITRTGLAWL
jgi:hypothetical protein